MYKIKLKEKEYLLPQNWDEVTFDQMLELKKLNLDAVHGNILATSLAISALMGCDKKLIMNLASSDFVKLAEATKWINSFDITPKFEKEFEFNGVKYMLIPDFTSLTIGEMASIEQYSIENVEANTDKILAILIREVGIDGNIVEFNADTVDSRASILRKNLKIGTVHAISAFFLDGREVFTQTIADSSEENQGIQMTQM